MDNLPIVILGSGVAGLYAALKLSPLAVTIVTPSFTGSNGSSYMAQGGIAAAVGSSDSPELHLQDTIKAGAGLVNEPMARKVIYSAQGCIRDLENIGVVFDKDRANLYALAKEAAHGKARVLHLSGDNSGVRLMQHLHLAMTKTQHITILDRCYAASLVCEGNIVTGVWILNKHHHLYYLPARAVIIATGGIAGLYEITTNPPYVLGQGIGMAARAGAVIMNSEFVQFHPTALSTKNDPVPLVTEALRGAGALLVNQSKERFLEYVHADQELAPRDVVARAIDAQIRSGNSVYLNAKHIQKARFQQDFPQVYASCIKTGINPLYDLIPVVPAAHYHIGGIATNADGMTSIRGLYAIGEVACTGMHGANRLASNSLLEGLVMANNVAVHAKSVKQPSMGKIPSQIPQHAASATENAWKVLRRTATQHIGIVRDEAGLKEAQTIIMELMSMHKVDMYFTNSCLALLAATSAALLRTESRGCHFRKDFPDTQSPNPSSLIWSESQQFVACLPMAKEG